MYLLTSTRLGGPLIKPAVTALAALSTIQAQDQDQPGQGTESTNWKHSCDVIIIVKWREYHYVVLE